MSPIKQKTDAMRAGIMRVSGKVSGMPVQDITLTRLLMISGGLVSNQLEDVLRPFGLSESDFRTLIVLFSSDEGCACPSEVCLFATQKPTNVTRIADGLVERGLIDRSHSHEDRRRIVLQITPEGKKLMRQLLPSLFQRVTQLMVGFTGRDKKLLDNLLGRLILDIEKSMHAQESGS